MENRTRWKSQSVLWKIKKPVWKHSHKKRKDSLETRVVFMEISIYLEIYQMSQNTGDHF